MRCNTHSPLLMNFACQGSPFNTTRQSKWIGNTVAEDVTPLPCHFDTGQDHQSWCRGPKFFEFTICPQVIMLGDDDAIQPDLDRGLNQFVRVSRGIGRVPGRVQVQVKLHSISFIQILGVL
jgi:hypothetical protein